eukprot:CCRYP_007742-RA/>CCRYP_007742-RA protein AED:0.39 eAED:0.39 QI:0/-1/0/1/-1/1/1/0/407
MYRYQLDLYKALFLRCPRTRFYHLLPPKREGGWIMTGPSSRTPPAPAAATVSQDTTPTMVERIRALDRSSGLSHLYTPLIMLDSKTREWAAVGNVETSFISSTLLQCRDEEGAPIFAFDALANNTGVTKNVLRINVDIKSLHEMNLEEDALFEKRTAALDNVTNLLHALGVISRKHSDTYPVSPFSEQASFEGTPRKLALVNRSTAPYLGIDSIGVHLHCYVCQKVNDGNKPIIEGVWLAKRASTKSHHPNCWDPTVAGGQPVHLSLHENIIKEAHEEAGVPSEWLRLDDSNASQYGTVFTDHTDDPVTITTAKPDGTCLKRSIYYSFDLKVPRDWNPTAVDGEVSEFKLYSVKELEEELRYGNSLRPAMRSVLLDFMIRHELWKENSEIELRDLKEAMRRKRLILW